MWLYAEVHIFHALGQYLPGQDFNSSRKFLKLVLEQHIHEHRNMHWVLQITPLLQITATSANTSHSNRLSCQPGVANINGQWSTYLLYMSSLTPSHHQGASSGTFRINISCDKPASSLCTESTEPAKRFDCMVQNYFGLNFWGFLLSFRVADWAQNHCKKNLSRLLWFSCTFTDSFIERRIYFIKYLYSSTWSVKKKKKKIKLLPKWCKM